MRVRAAAFSSDKSDDAYNDLKSFEGPLVSVLRKLENFIAQNTPTMAHFTDDLKRQNEPLYPIKAVREGLVNALAHRDYSSFSGNISIFIYPKRLEIINSGGFPEGVSAEKMQTGHISVLRNPDIAHVLYLRDLMEKLGRGSILIHNLLKEKGLPPPQWKEDQEGNVVLTFHAPQAAPQATPKAEKLLRSCVGEMLREELQDKLGITDRKYFRTDFLNPALDQGLIEMTMPEKATSPNQRYRLTAKGKQLKLLLTREGQEL